MWILCSVCAPHSAPRWGVLAAQVWDMRLELLWPPGERVSGWDTSLSLSFHQVITGVLIPLVWMEPARALCILPPPSSAPPLSTHWKAWPAFWGWGPAELIWTRGWWEGAGD